MEERVKHAAEFDRVCHGVAWTGAVVLAKRLKSLDQDNIDIAELNMIATAIQKFQQVGRLAIGEPTEVKVSEVSGRDGGPVKVGSVMEMVTVARARAAAASGESGEAVSTDDPR